MSTYFSNVVITGANRGLGLEFVKKISAMNECKKLVACCREPDSAIQLKSLASNFNKIYIKKLDVSNEESIINFSKDVKTIFIDGISLLINNAGKFEKFYREKNDKNFPLSIMSETTDSLMNSYKVNVIGPFLLTKNLLPLLEKMKKSLVFNITSSMGSIQENESGGSYNYRLSKTALNMLTKNFSIDLEEFGIICVSCHPGWVITDMGGKNALITSDISINGMIERIKNIDFSDSGKLIRFDNKPIKY